MWSVWQTCRTGRRAAGFLGGLLVALLLAAGPAAGVTFSDPMTLSNSGATAPLLAVTSSGQVYVAWREGTDIFFTRSLPSRGSCTGPGRLEFASPPVNLSNVDPLQVSAGLPAIAANDSGAVFVVWRELALTSTAVRAIRLRRSGDGGANFAGPQVLQPSGFTASFPNFPSVAADNDGGVFVAWQATVAANPSVVMAQSLDGGGTFAYGNITANRPSPATQPAVAAGGSNVYVAWRENGSSSGVWHKSFTRGGLLDTVGSALATQLTAASASNLRMAARGNQVAAAWLEGGNIKARTMTNGLSFDPEELIYSSTLSLGSVSLSLGGAGRFVAWQESSLSTFTSSIRFRLGLSTPETLRSGDVFAMNPAVPSGGADGTERLFASWQENGAAGTEIKLAYTGGSTGGGLMPAMVWASPRVLNYRTMGRGTGEQPNFTVFIELSDGSASDIDLSSVTLNGHHAMPHPSALGDHNGNGIPDLMVKFNRSVLEGTAQGAAVTAAQPDGAYTVMGNTRSGGCFSGSGQVQVTR